MYLFGGWWYFILSRLDYLSRRSGHSNDLVQSTLVADRTISFRLFLCHPAKDIVYVGALSRAQVNTDRLIDKQIEHAVDYLSKD